MVTSSNEKFIFCASFLFKQKKNFIGHFSKNFNIENIFFNFLVTQPQRQQQEPVRVEFTGPVHFLHATNLNVNNPPQDYNKR